MRYILFNKPYGVLSDMIDPKGRPACGQFVPQTGLFEAGRLDQDSEGLLFLTDDGALAHRLAHPHFHLPKTYLAQVERIPAPEALEALRRGILVKGRLTRPAEVTLLDGEPDLSPRQAPIRYQPSVATAWLRIVLREGRKRQVRHMTAAAGHPTLRLVRVALGPLTLSGLAPGAWRPLTSQELSALREAVGISGPA